MNDANNRWTNRFVGVAHVVNNGRPMEEDELDELMDIREYPQREAMRGFNDDGTLYETHEDCAQSALFYLIDHFDKQQDMREQLIGDLIMFGFNDEANTETIRELIRYPKSWQDR